MIARMLVKEHGLRYLRLYIRAMLKEGLRNFGMNSPSMAIKYYSRFTSTLVKSFNETKSRHSRI
jgi:hypothetical protein